MALSQSSLSCHGINLNFYICHTIAYLSGIPSPGMFNFDLPILHRPFYVRVPFCSRFFWGTWCSPYLLRRYYSSLKEFSHASSHTIKQQSTKTAEQLTFLCIIGAVFGSQAWRRAFLSKLGEILRHLLHLCGMGRGASFARWATGILVALFVYAKRP